MIALADLVLVRHRVPETRVKRLPGEVVASDALQKEIAAIVPTRFQAKNQLYSDAVVYQTCSPSSGSLREGWWK